MYINHALTGLPTLLRSERRDMVLDNLLDFTLNLRGDIALRDLFQQSRLCRGQVRTELTLPFCDLVDRDGIKLCDKLGQQGVK